MFFVQRLQENSGSADKKTDRNRNGLSTALFCLSSFLEAQFDSRQG
jgi:hypothetical protein